MRCSNCGAMLPEGSLYCNKCGQEIQIVTGKNLLEDDYLRSVLEEDTLSEPITEEESSETKETEEQNRKKEAYRRKRQQELRKKKIRRNIILTLVVLAAAICALIGFRYYHNTHSVTYLLSKAQESYEQNYYKTTLEYVDQVLALDENNTEALLLKGQTYVLMEKEEQAESAFLELIQIDPENQDAFSGLLSLYDSEKDFDKIQSLRSETENEDILALFDAYIPAKPVLSEESGTYSDYLTVTITADDNMKIYYTLDGSDPSKESTVYKEPVEISEQGEVTLKAICYNYKGYYSDIAEAVYEISLETPDMPEVSPDGGQFTQETRIYVTVPDGTTVYYSWSDSTPDETSTRYKGSITIPEGNNMLYLVAINEKGMSSKVVKCNYIYYPKAKETTSDTEKTDSSETTPSSLEQDTVQDATVPQQ